MSMHRWPLCFFSDSGTPAVARHLDTGPFRLARIILWPRLQRDSARTSSVSSPVRSTWLIDFASTTTKSIFSPCVSRTCTARSANSLSLRAFAKLSLASMRTTTAPSSTSALGKFRMSRKWPSGNLPHTARFGFPRSYMVLSTEKTNPTRRPSFTDSASETTKVESMTTNSARLALKATLKWCASMTPMAPWMMMGANAARGSFATMGSSSTTARKTRIEDMAVATSDVAPKVALTAVLEKDPVPG
mmetsp:Transcript_52794/g.150490  ORF Transcript_52794/g.150490 Transcript_52794/m.150490 type:complete len:246 (-) Transcript_52794:1402-2139(-)